MVFVCIKTEPISALLWNLSTSDIFKLFRQRVDFWDNFVYFLLLSSSLLSPPPRPTPLKILELSPNALTNEALFFSFYVNSFFQCCRRCPTHLADDRSNTVSRGKCWVKRYGQRVKWLQEFGSPTLREKRSSRKL